MKYLKRFNESIEDIDSICRKYGIRNYTVNPDGTVDVDGDVYLSYKNLTRLPLKFGKVSGGFWCENNQLSTLEGCPTSVGRDFSCQYNQLTTLEGCPENMSVGGGFYCNNNQLTTLEGCPIEVGRDFYFNNNQLTKLDGCPKIVGRSFYCYNNKLTTLEGCPTEVAGDFWCNNNQLTTLEGCPENMSVGGDFYCQYNKLTTLEGCPKEVGGDFSCYNNQLTIINWNDVYTLNPISFNLVGNPIFQVYRIFPDFKTFKDSLEWNYFKEPNIIIKERFVEACEILSEETGIKIKIPKKIKGYIFE